MDLSNSYETKFKTQGKCKIYITDRHAKLTPRYSREPYKLYLYYPLQRKSGSTNLSFPAQMCNQSNSDQKECMSIALHHAGNKNTFTCQNLKRNFTFYAKIQCKNVPQKVYATKSEGKYITPKFGCKICPQNFTPLKLDAKSSKILCCQNLYQLIQCKKLNQNLWAPN